MSVFGEGRKNRPRPRHCNRLFYRRKSGNLSDRSKLTLFARKSVAKRLVLFARLFYFGDDFGEQSSTESFDGGDGRTDQLRAADVCAGGRYFEFAPIWRNAARFKESDEPSRRNENRDGRNRTPRGDSGAGSTGCVFGS